ncbi:MAG: serine hydrolase domain-containing protein [Niveispirillum sp.]|uniref:serine hydrolase domain-containing protein n=1 Tax=Niveispirillum sp. TaxID=1917217 RepID=UPI003BA4E992
MTSRRLLLSLLATAPLLPLWPARAADADPSSPDLPVVTGLIQDAIRRHRLDGVAAIAHHRGRVLYRGYFGDIGPSTVMPVASASKWVAGLVIMALVAQGRLRLDLTLGQAGMIASGPAADITLAQLMSHTSALPAIGPVRQGWRYPTPAAAARGLAKMDLIGQPGQVFAYAGVSMEVAAALAEQAGGADWNSLFRQLIADPLGLSPSCRWGEKWGVGGGLIATPDDYERILLLIARQGLAPDGTRLLPAALITEMERDRIGGAQRKGQPDAAEIMKGYGIGLWCETILPDASCPVISSPGAFGTVPRIDRTRDLAILLMVKSRLPKLLDDWRAIVLALTQAADG